MLSIWLAACCQRATCPVVATSKSLTLAGCWMVKHRSKFHEAGGVPYKQVKGIQDLVAFVRWRIQGTWWHMAHTQNFQNAQATDQIDWSCMISPHLGWLVWPFEPTFLDICNSIISKPWYGEKGSQTVKGWTFFGTKVPWTSTVWRINRGGAIWRLKTHGFLMEGGAFYMWFQVVGKKCSKTSNCRRCGAVTAMRGKMVCQPMHVACIVKVFYEFFMACGML